MKDHNSRPIKGRHTSNWTPASVVRHPPVSVNGLSVGQSAPVFVKSFKAWRVLCTPDRLQKIGVVFCDNCSNADRRCTCPPMTECEAKSQGRSLRYDDKWSQ